MLFEDNMRILNEYFPDLYRQLREVQPGHVGKPVSAVTGKGGLVILKLGKHYLHDPQDPSSQARALIQSYGKSKIGEYSDILFYGIGMGYQVLAFSEEYPGQRFSLYEPVPEVFYQFLHHTDLQNFPLQRIRNIYLERGPGDREKLLTQIVRRIRQSILIIDLPSYRQAAQEQHQAFFARFEQLLEERRSSLAATTTFQKRWVINSINNFTRVLQTPDLLLEQEGIYQGQPALMVASGPSLMEEIENLREIKEKRLAYIFALGTALNVLIRHEILPDAVCSYDPTADNQIICREAIRRKVRTVPLIFGSTVGYETLDRYPGPLLHILTSQDTVSPFYLRPAGNGQEPAYVEDATTIAVIALQFLYRLGFNPIILVGQNLAYLDQTTYARGATYHPAETSRMELDYAVTIKDVNGKEILSSPTFVRMREQIEHYLKCYQDLKVINTTKGGAMIKGTVFRTLDRVLSEDLLEPVDDAVRPEPGGCSYDLDYLIERSRIMEEAQAGVGVLLDRCLMQLDRIGELAGCGNGEIINQSYEHFNQAMEQLRSNPFFAVFVTPMSRVELEFLMQEIPDISRERNPIVKAQLMEEGFRIYLQTCREDLNTITPLFLEMNRSLQLFINLQLLRRRAAAVRVLLVEIDGILSDGGIGYTTTGEEWIRINYRDLEGIARLKAMGIETLLIDRGRRNTAEIAVKLGAGTVSAADIIAGNVIQAGSLHLPPERAACICNDVTEAELLSWVGLRLTVKDMPERWREKVDYCLEARGGEGALLELARLLADRG